jgi:hypothetical protein
MPPGKTEILVLASPATGTPQADGSKGLFDRVPAPVSVDVELLKNNLSGFFESINHLLSAIPKAAEPFKLDEIELSIEVSAEGSIQLVGGVKAGATGGITLKLKR